MKRRLFALILIIGLALVGCTPAAPAKTPGQAESAYQVQIPPETGDGWETASLQEAGLDSAKLTVMMMVGWKALGIAAFFAAGNVTAMILLTVFQVLFLPGGSVVLLVLPVAFIVVPFSFWKARRKSHSLVVEE